MAGEDTEKLDPEGMAEGQSYGAEAASDGADSQAHSAEEDEIEQRIKEAVEAALAEQKDSVLRAQAEVQNMRRRCEADVEKAHKYALERFSTELLTVIDNLERALQAVPQAGDDAVKALYEGVELTLKGFMDTLEKFGVECIDPQGEPFDPQLHQAMSMQDAPDVEPNTVLAVMQKGYSLNGRVIRPAMVMVSSGGQAKSIDEQA